MGAAQPFVKSLGLMIDIHSMNIRRTDLNLLAVFEVLMQERNVTRAAGRLGLSQPAVSAALGRLRKNLGDALLVRSGHGMRPTPRAEQLGLSISQALDSMERALQLGATFVPAKARRSFTLMHIEAFPPPREEGLGFRATLSLRAARIPALRWRHNRQMIVTGYRD
jgi:DNA-binding transcriptional LysR family regulator